MGKCLLVCIFLAVFSCSVIATDYGIGIGIGMTTEEFTPLVWMCDHRVVVDDDIEPGRTGGGAVCSLKDQSVITKDDFVFGGACSQGCCNTWLCNLTVSGAGECTNNAQCAANNNRLGCYCSAWQGCILKGPALIERHNNYCFEGEKIEWLVLVMDKNKIEQVQEVAVTVGASQGAGNDIEVECVELHGYASNGQSLKQSCNARIDEELLGVFNDQTMAYFECTLTCETPDSMYGEYFVTVEAIDSTGLSSTMHENEYWFFNPQIAVTVDGTLDFGVVRPGTISYSDTLLIGNAADAGSGVTLDMFISGTDFYDPASAGARCVITNRLKLGDNIASSANNGPAGVSANRCSIGFGDADDHLCYFATNGFYGTDDELLGQRRDAEGYAPIVYGNTFSTAFYNDAEIIQANRQGGYWHGNLLTPGAEMALTFKLGLPEPCVGDFSDGSIYFWGEAI